MIDNEILFKAVQEKDEGLYTFWAIDERGTYMFHINLTVDHYDNSWYDWRNPLAWFKSGLLISLFSFLVIATLHYISFNERTIRKHRNAQTELNENRKLKLLKEAKIMALKIRALENDDE